MKTLLTLVLLVGVAHAEPAALIPRDVLTGNPEKANPKLSPDGKRIAWVAPDPKNVLQVWVKTVGGSDEKNRLRSSCRSV